MSSIIHFNCPAIILIRKGIPTAMAVQSRGVSTRRDGSLRALQLTARIAAPGISQSRAKLVYPTGPERTPRREKIKQTTRGSAAGRATISIQALTHRENPNPPGVIKDPIRNWRKATMLPRSNAQIPPELSGPERAMDRQKR
jgi:hypothetical protein